MQANDASMTANYCYCAQTNVHSFTTQLVIHSFVRSFIKTVTERHAAARQGAPARVVKMKPRQRDAVTQEQHVTNLYSRRPIGQ
jgi:hypothetical protein